MDNQDSLDQAVESVAPRLQSTPVCLNCGADLQGDFCFVCGQRVKEVRRPFLVLLQEMLFVILELDGRAYRTVFLLLTRPAYLSRAFIEGRRASYTPPLRLFLFITIAFLLFVSGGNLLSDMREAMDTPVELASANEDSGVEPDIQSDEPDDNDLGDGISEGADSEGGVVFDAEDMTEVHEFIDQISLPWVSEQNMVPLRNLMHQQVESNLEELRADPGGFFMESLDYLTFFILLMMPILALYQKVLLVFSGKYYIEHLVLTLHNHTFLILAVFVMVMFDLVAGLSVPYVSQFFDIASILVALWIPIYLFLSLKFFVGWGYFVTGILFSITSLLYLVTMAVSLLVFGATLFLLV